MQDPLPPQMARLEFEITYPIYAYFYGAFTPTMTIDGRSEKVSWGTQVMDLAPGEHTLSGSYPWLFVKECGKGTVQLSLAAGEVVKVIYEARLIRYWPGKMTVIRVHH